LLIDARLVTFMNIRIQLGICKPGALPVSLTHSLTCMSDSVLKSSQPSLATRGSLSLLDVSVRLFNTHHGLKSLPLTEIYKCFDNRTIYILDTWTMNRKREYFCLYNYILINCALFGLVRLLESLWPAVLTKTRAILVCWSVESDSLHLNWREALCD
jgi:hypothetical protein